MDHREEFQDLMCIKFSVNNQDGLNSGMAYSRKDKTYVKLKDGIGVTYRRMIMQNVSLNDTLLVR